MPDDETVCGETEADVARQQVKILERRIAELEAELAASKAELLDDKGQDIRITLGGRIADLTAELAELNAEECEECESTLGDLMRAAHPSVATWFCLKCWNAAIGKATTAERERCARAIEALAVDPNRDEREYVNTVLAYTIAAVKRGASGAAK